MIHNVQQGTQEWLNLRMGKITGTRLKELMAKDNLGLIDEMIAEINTGKIEPMFENFAMKQGTEREPFAREHYQRISGNSVTEVGFITSDEMEYLGCSPDGVILLETGEIGGLEIKCPQPKNYAKYLRQNQIPNEYKYQVYNYFICMPNMAWLDFVAFNPDFESKPMLIVRIERDSILEELKTVETAIKKFWQKLNDYNQEIFF